MAKVGGKLVKLTISKLIDLVKEKIANQHQQLNKEPTVSQPYALPESVSKVEQSSQHIISDVKHFVIESDKQGKHIRGHKNFIEGKSELTYHDYNKLVDKFVGKGEAVNDVPKGQPGYKERFDAKEIIGIYRDKEGRSLKSTKGMIVYSKKGIHMYPAQP